MNEEWKDIIGYEGLYQISNFGNVKALEKSHHNQFGAKITFKEKILKPIPDRYGYLIVSLSKKGKAKRFSIARLVGLHFLPSPEDKKMVVAHINSKDKLNNNVTNLTWNYINKCRAIKTNKVREFIKNDDFVNIDIESVSGIYKITNIINDNFYIGSAFNILKRLMRHFWELRLNKSSSTKLQRAYNKYGEGNFKIELLEPCEKSQLEQKEQYYIDTLKPELNIALTAFGGCGKHSEESKLKMSKSLKERYANYTEKQVLKHKENCSLARKGKKDSEETKLKKSISIKNSEKHKKAMVLNYEKRINALKLANTQKLSKPILQYTKNNEFIKEFSSIINAQLETGNGNIVACLKGRRKTANGFIWKYKNI